MSTMIERVAAALWHSRSVGKWEDAAPLARNYTMEDARAAIEAMREPTEGELDEAYWQESGDLTRPEIKRAYTAMIDAVLKETT